MARIPPDEIERLKKAVSLQKLAEARGIKLKRHGKSLIGLCIFHEDKKPSLVIDPEKNLWNCLGACSTGGTVIDWVMKAEGVSFRHAVEILREGANLPSTDGPVKPFKKLSTVPKLASPVNFGAEEQEALQQTVDYYHATLKQSPEALSYLAKRGLKHSEMIDRFKIGYVNRTLGFRLPDKNRKAGAAIREKLTRVGLLRESGHEHFSGAVVFPIFNEAGIVTEIYGRRLRDDRRPDIAYHLYLPGPHRGVWNIEALEASKEIILCEAIIDALTFWCAGLRNVTASYGVNGFTRDHLAAFKKYGIEKVFLAYDHDEAGNKAAEKLAAELTSEGFGCYRILFPRGMDANEYALKVGPAEKSLGLVYRNAIPMGKNRVTTNPAPEAETRAEGRPEEPKEAAKWENILEESPGLETGTRSEEPANIFSPLAAEKNIEESPAPASEPPRPDVPPAGNPEPAAPVPQEAAGPTVEVRGEEIRILFVDRKWRIRGLARNMSYDQLKVNVLVSRGEAFYVDTFDLYSARSRALFLKQAAEELRVKEDSLKSELGKVLFKLEDLQDKQIKDALEPKEQEVILTPEEKAEALKLLQDPNLLPRILSDFEKCGIVGEETNKLVGYLAAVSRKIRKPLGVIIQSSSSAGKTSLMEAVLAFMPDEERVKYSAMTGQALFYMGETNLKHKILAIVEEEGAERASYALKLLQSEGALSIASTGKDPTTGKLVTHEYKVQGPVMLFITTTKIEIDDELKNRCIMLTVDESREQTRAIHRIQREMRTMEGLIASKERARLVKLHQNAQRLLQSVYVVNRFAPKLTFLDDQLHTRRANEKYLNLIEAITLLHQHQRPLKTGNETGEPLQCLEVTLEDIDMANKLTNEILGHSLDELPPQTRRFLMLLDDMVRKACERLDAEGHPIDRSEYRFYRRDILDYTGWSYNQLRIHLERLIELEYILIHRGHQGQRFSYELLYDGKGKDGKPFCVGLIDTEAIKKKSEDTVSTLWGQNQTLGGKTGDFVPRLFPVCAPLVGGVLGQATEDPEPVSGQKTEVSEKNAYKGEEDKTSATYPQPHHTQTPAGKGNGGNGSSATLKRPA